ncbi:MAG TPA: hypothetical protein VFT43_04085 [Candidatus Polarisedimenticolia bacterium]|nr:hypothetical protein [Candidatus Polarisedimenticolia bacterium]
MTHQGTVQEQIKRMRALIQAGRERVSMLSPAWGAHLAGETMRRLGEVVDELAREVGVEKATEQAPLEEENSPDEEPTRQAPRLGESAERR